VVVIIAILTGGTLQGILGALLALPVAAAIIMIIRQLRVELPGEAEPSKSLQARDAAAEKEYEKRAAGADPRRAAAIAASLAERIRKGDAPDDAEEAADVPLTDGKGAVDENVDKGGKKSDE